MPFTFSHPAIVLPFGYLHKRWISMTGLVIGSMIPDFEYFIRMKVKSIYSHTWSGLFWFDLPIALVAFFIYQILVKNKLIDNLPTALNRRFLKFKTSPNIVYSLQYLSVITLSILTGATSHILWDGFTHPNGFIVKLLPMFSKVIKLGNYRLHFYQIIQHTSTLIGALVIMWVIYKLPLANYKTNRHIILYWFIVMFTIIGVLIIRIMAACLTIYQFMDTIVTVIAGGLLGLIIASVILKKNDSTISGYD